MKKWNYYDAGGISVIDYIKAKLTPEQFKGFLLGNIIKYSGRLNHKDGCRDGDIEKLSKYSQWLEDFNKEEKDINFPNANTYYDGNVNIWEEFDKQAKKFNMPKKNKSVKGILDTYFADYMETYAEPPPVFHLTQGEVELLNKELGETKEGSLRKFRNYYRGVPIEIVSVE